MLCAELGPNHDLSLTTRRAAEISMRPMTSAQTNQLMVDVVKSHSAPPAVTIRAIHPDGSVRIAKAFRDVTLFLT